MNSRPPRFQARLCRDLTHLLLSALLLLLPGLTMAQTAWTQAVRTGNEMRFLFTGSIQRYNLATKTWQTPVTLPRSGATAFAADATNNYVAYGTAIYRYSTAFGAEAAAGTASSSIQALYVDGSLLLAVHSSGLYGRITSFTKTTGAKLDTREVYVDSIYGSSHTPGSNKLFGRTSGISPSDIVMASYTDAGIISGPSGSRYHGDYPGASRTFVSADERRVVDTSGTIYTTDDLTYLGSLEGAVTDIEWNGTAPVVLRDNLLIAYRNTYKEAARVTLAAAGAELAITGGEAFVFAAGTTQPSVEIVPLSAIPAPDPDEVINPAGMEYTVDSAFADRDGVIHLYNKSLMSLFRWSTADRAYRSTVNLNGAPSYVAYSKENHAAYTAYPSLHLRKISLSPAVPAEVNFITLPEPGIALTTAGGFIYSITYSNYEVYGAAGNLVGKTGGSNYVGRENAYDPVRRRFYHFRDGLSPNDLIYESIGSDGLFTGSMESPYHGDYDFYAPIRVSPDGNKVLTGSGALFNASDLRNAGSIANPVTDAVWKDTTIVSLRLINGLTQLQTWTGPAYTSGAVRQFGGTPVRIFDTPQGLALVTSVAGTPRFTLLNDTFDPVYVSPTRPNAPSGLTVAGRTVDSITLKWTDLSDNEDGFRLEYRPSGSTGTWTAATTTAAGAATGTVDGLTLATTYEFRVSAVTANLVSAPAASVTATTLSSPDQPAGEPYNLAATRIYQNSITLAWTDNATNETGFRIFRSTSPGGTATPLNTAPNATSYTDFGILANTTYYYRIRSMNGTVEGDLSAQISVKTLAAAAAPAAPSLLTASEITASSVRLTWKDNSSNEDQFIIDRSTSPVTTWTEAGRATYNSTAFLNTGLQPNTTYTFRVRSSNTTGSTSAGTITATTLKLGGEYRNIAMRQGDVYYLAFTGPNRLERYDLVKREWMTPLALDGQVTALWGDAAGIYVAEGRAVSRWNPDGTGRTPVANSQYDVYAMFTVGNVFAFQGAGIYSGMWTTVNKQNGTVLATFDTSYSVAGVSVDSTLNRAFSRSTGVSPSDIRYIDVGTDGKLIREGDSPYHGEYPSASRTFVFPKGGRVVDDAGTVYITDGLAYSNTLGAAFKDLAFLGDDIPVVLRGNKLHSYRNNLTEAGSITLSSAEGQRVAVDGSDALVFITDGSDPRGMRVQTVPLASFNTPEPNQPLNPEGFAYTIDDAFLDRDGIINLYSRGNLSLFRWSSLDRAYKPTVALTGGPSYITYSNSSHSVFLAYGSQAIRKLDLRNTAPAETLFATMASRPGGIAAAGDFVYAVKSGGYVTYSPAGALLSDSGFTYYTSATNTWDPIRRRIYHFRDGISPGDLHYDTIGSDGFVSGTGETPYHGDFSPSAPIRVSPDGAKIALGSGVIFNASDMTKAATLSVTLTDMAWMGGLMTSLEPQGTANTLVQRWSSTWAREKSVALGGTPIRCFTLASGRLAVVTRHATGIPRFHILDSSLVPVYDSVPTPPAILEPPLSNRVDFGTSASLRVLATGSPTLRYQWFKNGEALPGATADTLTIPAAGSLDSGSYTVTVTNNGGSATSAAAGLGVGPIASPLFAAGRLLVSSAGKIHEYTAANTLVRSLSVPMAPEATSQRTYDVVVDRLGLVHVINQGALNGSNQYYLSTYDSEFNTWLHRSLTGFTYTYNGDADVAIWGDWAITRYMRIHLRTGEIQQLPINSFYPVEVSVGRDDDIYGVSTYGELRRLSSSTWTWSSQLNLNVPTELHGLGINEDGILYAGLATPSVQSYSTSGTQLAVRNLNNPDTAGAVQDVSISPTGQIVTGNARGYVTLLNAALSSHTYLAMPVTGSTGTYTTWMPSIAQPLPDFAATTAPAAAEDKAWEWSPKLTHPDPDAVLTLTALQIPSWMRLSGNRLSGTPLQADAGNHAVVLRVTDAAGRSADRTFTVSAAAVNDTPLARNLTLERREDDPAEEIDLTALITDEEDASLTFDLIASDGSTVSAAISGPDDDRLGIAFLPNAFGTSTFTVRGRDGESLFADTVITIHTAPVNDPPAGRLDPEIMDEDAPAAAIRLDDFFADVETADGDLIFAVESSRPDIATAVLSGHTLHILPQPNAFGSLTVTVRATDGDGASIEVPLAVSVLSVNDLPAGALDSIDADEDATLAAIALDDFFADIETPDAALTFTAESSLPGTVAVELDGHSLRLVPQLNAFGSVTVTVRATDTDGGFIQVPLFVRLRPVNDLPAGSLADIVASEDDAPVIIDLHAAFADVETPDAELQFHAVSGAPETGAVAVHGGQLILTPQPDANGTFEVTVQCDDTGGGSLTVRFTVTLQAVNDVPAFPAGIPDISAGDAARDAVLDFAPLVRDPDAGDTQTWRLAANTNPGLFSELTMDPSGRLTIRYAPYVSGTALVTVEVRDTAGTAATWSFLIDLPALPPPGLTTVSTLTLNRQTGLWEQRVTVRNDGQRAIGGFEISVAGLPADACLYNASDCLRENPLTGYYQPVAVGESVSLVLEYYSPGRSAALRPVLATSPVLPRDAASAAAGTIAIDRAEMLEPGAFLLEFTATPGDLFTVQYTTDGRHWLDSFVRVRAAGTRVQWIDQGAPRTLSPPLPGQTRLYRILKVMP